MWFGAWRLKLHTVCWAMIRACWTASQSIRFMSYQQIDEPKGPARGQWYCWLEAILLLAVTHQRTFALLHSIVATDNVWWLSRARSLWIIYLDSCAGSSFKSIIWFPSRCLDFSVSQLRLNEWNKSTSVSIINFYLLLSIKTDGMLDWSESKPSICSTSLYRVLFQILIGKYPRCWIRGTLNCEPNADEAN